MFRLQQTRSIFLLAKTGPLYIKSANVAQLKQGFRPLNVNSTITKFLSNNSRPHLTRFNTCIPLQRTFISNSNHGSITRKDKEDEPPVITTIKRELKEDIYTIPNILTFGRLLAAPAVGYLILQHNYNEALGLFALAGFTDLLDGYIARRYNMKTLLGTIIDPLADKVLMTVMTVTLAMEGTLPVPLAAVILGRDVGLILSGFYYRYISLSEPKTLSRYFDVSIPSAEVKPTQISKINTALQLLLMGLSLTTVSMGSPSPEVLHAFQWVVGGTTVWSGASYIFSKDAIRILKR